MTEQPFILKITRKWTAPHHIYNPSPPPKYIVDIQSPADLNGIPMTDIIYVLVADTIEVVKMERLKRNKVSVKFEDEISFADDVVRYVAAYLEGKKLRALDGEEHYIERINDPDIIAKYMLLKE